MEIKAQSSLDTRVVAWLGLAKYIREVVRHHSAHRFVWGTTLCGSKIRLRRFDPLGAVTSPAIDTHVKAVLFVKILVAVLLMGWMLLGFDLDLAGSNGQRSMVIRGAGAAEAVTYQEVAAETVVHRRSCHNLQDGLKRTGSTEVVSG